MRAVAAASDVCEKMGSDLLEAVSQQVRAIAAVSDVCENLGSDLHEAVSQLSKAGNLQAQNKLALEQFNLGLDQMIAKLKSGVEASQASVLSSYPHTRLIII